MFYKIAKFALFSVYGLTDEKLIKGHLLCVFSFWLRVLD